jgi:voltage-gated potassium channel
MNQPGTNHHEKVGPFQIIVLVLTIVVLAALGVDTAIKLPPEISRILGILDTMVCILLFVDFCIRFRQAESKLAFMKWGWIDLVASIPNIQALRVGRFIRILRLIRLLRAIRATHKLSSIFLKDKIQTGVAGIVLSAFLLVMFCSVAILICEQQDTNANIKTAGDAIWWAMTTITTVGYGDKYPVTALGRIVAMILMTAGIGTFGVLSGLAASFFIGPKQKSIVHEENKILARLEKLEEKIDRLKREQ